MPRWLPYVLDAVLVVVFASLGRGSHQESLSLGGIALTAWPFLVGLVVAWAVTALVRGVRERGLASLTAGLVVWPLTVVLGMIVRVASGRTAHWSFILVATITLAVLLLGWRALATVIARRR